MNGRTTKKIYMFLAQRDGEYCKKCKSSPVGIKLVVDHIDNNPTNNSLENLQLLCRRCNYFKNPRRPLDQCVSDRENPIGMNEIETSTIRKPQFKTYLAQRVNEEETVSEWDFINSAAKVLDISPVTARRWLYVECCSEGIYERSRIGSGFVIRYKPELKFS